MAGGETGGGCGCLDTAVLSEAMGEVAVGRESPGLKPLQRGGSIVGLKAQANPENKGKLA